MTLLNFSQINHPTLFRKKSLEIVCLKKFPSIFVVKLFSILRKQIVAKTKLIFVLYFRDLIKAHQLRKNTGHYELRVPQRKLSLSNSLLALKVTVEHRKSKKVEVRVDKI